MDLLWTTIQNEYEAKLAKCRKTIFSAPPHKPSWKHTPLENQPNGLRKDIVLFPYQLDSVGWMIEVENKIARTGKNYIR